MNETSWLRPAAWGGGVNSYAGIEGGMFSDAAAQIVNHGSASYSVSGASDDTVLGNAVANGKLIGFASSSNPTNSQVVGDHQYIVIAYNSSTKTVTLFNPWGLNNGSSHPGLLAIRLSRSKVRIAVTAVTAIQFLPFLAARKFHFRGIDYYHMVARINRWGVHWFVFTHQEHRCTTRNPAQDRRIRVDHVPGTHNFGLGWIFIIMDRLLLSASRTERPQCSESGFCVSKRAFRGWWLNLSRGGSTRQDSTVCVQQ